mgnify:CR=1 FL=1
MKDETCCICFNDISSNSNYTMTECNHLFCSSCIFEWLTRKPICPICRKKLIKSSIPRSNSNSILINNIRIDSDINEFEYMEYLMNHDNDFRVQYHRIGLCVQTFFLILTIGAIGIISYIGYIIIT